MHSLETGFPTTISNVLAYSGLAFSICLPASAESPSPNPFENADEVIVSASHSPRTRATIPTFTTVLEGKDLETSVSPSVADALRFVPGLQLTQEGARGGRASLSLRGLDPNHVVILVDGVRLNDPTNSRGGSFDPTTLALIDIDRIEIIRGPQSSIYGSDAIAGVVNVITRSARVGEPATASLRTRGGRFHMANVAAQASGPVADVAALSIGAGIDTFRDPNSRGGYDGVNAKAKLNLELPFEIDLEAFSRLHYSSSRGFPDSSGGPELAALRQLEDRNVRELLFGLTLEREIPLDGKLILKVSRSSRREDLESPGIDREPDNPANFDIVPPSTAGDEYKRWDLGLSSSWDLPAFSLLSLETRTNLVTGVAFIWENGESDTYFEFPFSGGPMRFPFFERRQTIGVFAEVEEKIGPYVVASASLRFDSIRNETDRISPAAGLSVEIPGTPITLFGSYGEGFKLPSFYALGNPIVGNRSLLAEKSRGWEAGLRGHAFGDRISGQISYFDIEVKDIIDFDNTGFIPKLVNRSRLVSRGVEVELHWHPVEWLELRGGAIFNPTDFAGTHQPPQNRSKWRGSMQIVWTPLPSVIVNLRALAVGSSKATSFQTRSQVYTLAGYERVDLRVGWRLRDWIELFVEVENLTNRTYREAVGFEAPGIAPRLGMTLRH